MRVQQTGVSRGQLAEIWAASRRCWGSLKSLGFPAASPSPHHSFTDTRSGHRWSRVQNRSFVYPDGRARAPGTATRLECLHPNKPQAPRSAPAPRLGCKRSDSHPRGQRRGAADAAIITVSPGKPVPGVSPTPYSLPGDVLCISSPMQTGGGGGEEGEPALPAPRRPPQQGAGERGEIWFCWSSGLMGSRWYLRSSLEREEYTDTKYEQP